MKLFVIVFLILVVAAISPPNLHGQYVEGGKRKKKETQKSKNSEQSFLEKLRFGGNIGGGFGDPTFADVSPTIGYQVSEKFELGLGPSYTFYRFKNDNFRGDDHLYGGRIYGQWQIYKTLSLRGEVEGIRVGLRDSLITDSASPKEWQLAPLVGANVQFKFLGRVNFQFTLLYNPLHEDGRSWRATPWVTRFGFGL